MIKIFFIAMLFTLLVSCGKTIDNPAAKPTDKLSNNWWKERHEMIAEKNKSNPQLILLGNSILNSLDKSSEEVIWEKYLNKYNTVNMGFSGDRTENLNWRLQNGEINGISPKVALLLIGTNNTDGNHYLNVTQPEELAGGIWEICKIVREKLPDTEILLLGIFPYGYKPNYRDNINKATNKIIAKFPREDSHIHYRNIGSIFVDDNNKVKKSLMPDYLHPNTEGYLLMFKAIEKDIEKLMK
ncbi:MAG: GDSL-type esterase/lipase family protein [Draconibacterium sp.]|nr:GDSL-type esterase/lipase family protein [Draconibacterium sp.]